MKVKVIVSPNTLKEIKALELVNLAVEKGERDDEMRVDCAFTFFSPERAVRVLTALAKILSIADAGDVQG